MNNCPFKPADQKCRLEIDYIVLKESLRETQEVCCDLRDENRYLWNHLDKINMILGEHGIALDID